MWQNYLKEMKESQGNILPIDKYIKHEIEESIENLDAVFKDNDYGEMKVAEV